MNIILRNTVIIFILCAFFIVGGFYASAEEEETEYAPFPYYELEVPIGSKYMVTDVADYIRTIYTFGVSIIGVVATVMIMFGGMKWLLAAGSQSKIGDAKEIIISAVVGLVLALTSYLLLNTINPKLVTMSSIAVETIKVEAQGMEVTCVWSVEADVDLNGYLAVNNTECAGDKPADADACYCNLRENIVAAGQKYASAYSQLSYECCWGWAENVYNEAGAKRGSVVQSNAMITNMDGGDMNGGAAGCAACDNSYENTSACTDGAFTIDQILPGDWLFIMNGHCASGDANTTVPLHSIIFLGWTNEANKQGSCASGGVNGNGPYASQHSCDFVKTPVTHIIKPTGTAEYSTSVGGC